MRTLQIAGILIGQMLGIAAGATTEPTRLFWTDVEVPGHITQAELDGTGVMDVLTFPHQGGDLAIDPIANKMYWTVFGDNIVRRANLDGTNIEQVIDLSGPVGRPTIGIDPIGRKVYWRQVTIPDTETVIGRSNYDGSAVETLATLDRGGSGSLAVDPIGKQVFWTTQQFGAFGFTNVRRMDFDGSSIEVIASGLRYSDIEIDPIEKKVYWITVDTGDRRIQRANLDGSNLEDILPDTLDFSSFPGYVHLPRSLAVDPMGNRLYWINDQFRDDRVMSAALDGTDIAQLFASPRSGLNRIAINSVVPESSGGCLLLFGIALCSRSRRLRIGS